MISSSSQSLRLQGTGFRAGSTICLVESESKSLKLPAEVLSSEVLNCGISGLVEEAKMNYQQTEANHNFDQPMLQRIMEVPVLPPIVRVAVQNIIASDLSGYLRS